LLASYKVVSREMGEMEHNEVKSENARNVILSYNDKIYYVNSVNVAMKEGADRLKAIFHAKRASDNAQEDLDIEINQNTYDILMEYARLDKLDLIMVLQIEGTSAKYCLMSEEWLKNPLPVCSSKGYIV
jgi:hypothetical protein